VLWLDAGDRLSPEDAIRLKEQIESDSEKSSASLMFVEIPANGPSAPERIAQVRLAPNHPQIKFAGRVRETMVDSLTDAQVGIEPFDISILRHPHVHDSTVKAARATRNIRLAEAEIRESAARSELLNCLGDAFQTLEDHDRANQFFQHALNASEPGSPDMLEAYYGIVTSLDVKSDQVDVQLATCMKALEVFPVDAQLLCAMGGYLQAQGQTELAMKAYRTTCEHGRINPGVWHVSNIDEIATICLSLTLQILGREEEAIKTLLDAVASGPPSLRIRRHLVELFIKAGDRDKALQQLDEFPSDFPNRDAFRSVVRGACLASASNWIPAKAYLKTGYDAGSRDPICLRWYATTLIASDDTETARPIVAEWIQIEPNNSAAQQFQQMLEPADESPVTNAPERTVRIDGSELQQSHLTSAPSRSSIRHGQQQTQ
jgi:tetratricopeptide (TPR) repeat protein